MFLVVLSLGCLTEAKLTPRATIALPGPSGALALEGDMRALTGPGTHAASVPSSSFKGFQNSGNV
jgi:hypothetical protein